MSRARIICSAAIGLASGLVLGSGCHSDGHVEDLGAPADQSVVSSPDLGPGDAATGDAAVTVVACPHATARPVDGPRALVVSHPFANSSGGTSPDFELLQVDAAGAITRPNTHFSLHATTLGTIVFTPDGTLGFVAADDGTIGEFQLAAGQAPKVIEAARDLTPTYATGLVMSPMGDQLLVLDAQTQDNGGGIYAMPIGCDGALGAPQLVTAAALPYALLPLPSGQAALFAPTLPGAPAADDVHLVEVGPPFARIADAVAFATADGDAIIAGAAATHDGKFALFGDNNEFGAATDRIAVMGLTATAVTSTQTLMPVQDPVAIVTSPYDNAALVASGYGNAVFGLAYDPTSATTPFTNNGAITYVGAAPQLPGAAVMIEVGTLEGTVLLAESGGVRTLRFETAGTITDHGLFDLGTDVTNAVGAIGVQP